MKEVRSPDGKRVCDISDDSKLAVIVRRGFATRISAKPDGTLLVEHERVPQYKNVA